MRALDAAGRGALRFIARELESCAWTTDAIEAALFDAARRTPIDYDAAFRALFTALLGRDSGPRAGNLLAFLERTFVIARLREVPCDPLEFWSATASGAAELETWLTAHAAQIRSLEATPCVLGSAPAGRALGLEIVALCDDGRSHVRRVRDEGEVTRSLPDALPHRFGFALKLHPARIWSL